MDGSLHTTTSKTTKHLSPNFDILLDANFIELLFLIKKLFI